MKPWVFSAALIAATAVPALGQFQPCVTVPREPIKMIRSTQTIRNMTGEYGLRVIYADGTYKDQFPSTPLVAREPELVDAFSQVYKTNAGSYWQISFLMPVAGKCVGQFESYDDRSDTYKVIQDAAGRYVRVPIRTAGDVELLIIAEAEWQRIRGNISTSSYRAIWSSGRSYGGKFGVELQAGWYRLVIYNGYSLAAKSIDLTFGGKLRTP